jgi:hypothetical protein
MSLLCVTMTIVVPPDVPKSVLAQKVGQVPHTQQAKRSVEEIRLSSMPGLNQRLRKKKPLPTNGTSQNSKQDTSTMFRLVRGTLDGTPRLRSDSYEARSTGRLDHVLTRTRLAR